MGRPMRRSSILPARRPTRRLSCSSYSRGYTARTICPIARTCATNRAAGGCSQTLGVGKSTVTLSDLEHADLIFSIGQNPGTNHPRMLTSLLAAKRNGATIIDVNPLPEVGLLRFKHPQEPMHLLGAGTRLSDRLLQVRINGDVALLKGIIKTVLEAEDRSPGTVLDWDFIREPHQRLRGIPRARKDR